VKNLVLNIECKHNRIMSIQLQGTGLVIKGKTIVSSDGNLYANNLSAQTIDIKHGGLKVRGSSNITGDLTVTGNIIGDSISYLCNTLLKKNNSKLVGLLAKVGEDNYVSLTGVFISSDGWVVTNSSSLLNTNDVWGTIYNPSSDKDVDVLSADGVFVDELSGLCFIKFDVSNHKHFEWADHKSISIGDPCFMMTFPIHPINEISITKSTINYTNFRNNGCRCILTSLNQVPKPGSIIINSRGELICIIQFGYDGLYGGVMSNYIKHSAIKIMDTMDDVRLNTIPSLGILDCSSVTHLELVLSGLLGIYPPKGFIINKLRDDSVLSVCNPPIQVGNIITHINGVCVGVGVGEGDDRSVSVNDLLFNSTPGETITIKFISPPSIEEHVTRVQLQCMSKDELLHSCKSYTLDDVRISKKPYITDYENINARHAQDIYEVTHQDEIKYKKKLYLLDRLKNVKNRKLIKSRVKSRNRQ